ncbi:hypothetical protein V6N13_096948 [Hibiscus sabdariffa]|uniref:Uncharacterized protein n=2 Tax=Hibiscus sabdariffa TaxID=183260 RepID=A0ABR2PFG9_9ROSI
MFNKYQRNQTRPNQVPERNKKKTGHFSQGLPFMDAQQRNQAEVDHGVGGKSSNADPDKSKQQPQQERYQSSNHLQQQIVVPNKVASDINESKADDSTKVSDKNPDANLKTCCPCCIL